MLLFDAIGTGLVMNARIDPDSDPGELFERGHATPRDRPGRRLRSSPNTAHDYAGREHDMRRSDMDRFKTYIAAVDGSNGWEVIEPLFMDAFHPDGVVVTADGEMDRDGWATMAQGLVARGASISGFEVTSQSDDSVAYRMTIDFPDAESMHLAATATLEDGRFIRVEPMDPARYSELVQRSH